MDPVIEGGTPPAEPAWQSAFESFKTSDPEVWSSLEKRSEKDLPTFVKSAVSLEKKLGSSLVRPNKDNPEELNAFKEKLYADGILARPAAIPESPDAYELKALESVPENLRMPELISEFKTWAHKNGIPAEAANQLIELNAKQFTAANQMYEGSKAEAEARIGELAKRDGRDMNAVMEGGKRAAMALLKDSPKTLEKLNMFLGNDPDIMYALSRMGEALGEDTSMLGDGTVSQDITQALNEANDIVRNKANPKYEAYHKGDPAVNAYVQQLLKKGVPGTVEI